MGLFTGIGLRLYLGTDSDWSAFLIVFVVSVAGITFSWVVSAALFGDAGESGRIPGFFLAVLLGSVLARAWNAGRRPGVAE
ncbi:hypothetical protein ACFOUR_11665 [Halovivax cerinus]|uniref:GlsB/YeaQ/YmgE family stress response membrane protein n=2 Tax=Halovivax cerinus TaxID=1487865 RepID=A0ABD5NPV1_9EURY